MPTPQQHLANRIRAGFTMLLRERGVDPEFGRTLPRLLRDLGLVDVGADAYLPLAVPATVALEQANVEQVRAALVALRSASDDEIDAHLAAARPGALDVATPPLVSAGAAATVLSDYARRTRGRRACRTGSR